MVIIFFKSAIAIASRCQLSCASKTPLPIEELPESFRTVARERARLYTHAARFYRMVEDLRSAQQ